jgi:hypothetical protein
VIIGFCGSDGTHQVIIDIMTQADCDDARSSLLRGLCRSQRIATCRRLTIREQDDNGPSRWIVTTADQLLLRRRDPLGQIGQPIRRQRVDRLLD